MRLRSGFAPGAVARTVKAMQLDHVEVFVPDRDAAVTWYGEWLGFAVIEEHRHWAETGPLMMTNDGGATMLALFVGPAQDGASESVRGWRRVAFRTDAGAWLQFLARVRASGQELDGPYDHEKAWSVYFSDPWGNRLEVTTYDYAEVAAELGDTNAST